MTKDAVEKLCDKWGVKTPERAIIKAIYHTLPELRHVEPPVDIMRLAAKRNVLGIRNVTMALDGTISLLNKNEYVIELNRAHPISRRRFTCGHEIGHTFFLELDDEITVRANLRIEDENVELMGSTKQEERLCNVAAAEILMPHGPFSSMVRSAGILSRSIISLSQAFKTSLLATSRRLVEVSPIKILIALWEYYPEPGLYKTVWVVQDNSNCANQTFIVDKSIPIFKTFESLPRFRGRKWISLGGPIDDYFVDGILLSNSFPKRILTVFVLEKFADKLFTIDPIQLHLF